MGSGGHLGAYMNQICASFLPPCRDQQQGLALAPRELWQPLEEWRRPPWCSSCPSCSPGKVLVLVRSHTAADTLVPVQAAEDKLEVVVPLDLDHSHPLLHGTGGERGYATCHTPVVLYIYEYVNCVPAHGQTV